MGQTIVTAAENIAAHSAVQSRASAVAAEALPLAHGAEATGKVRRTSRAVVA